MDMSKICKTCHRDPSSHSFSKLCENDGVSIFYTNPGEASKYDDRVGIIAHMDNMLTNHVRDRWAWIFDGSGFQHYHLMELQLTRDIITLLTTKHNSTLSYIHIKNANGAIRQLFRLIVPIMGESTLLEKVRFD